MKPEISNLQIVIKNKGIEDFLCQVANHWTAMYPKKADYFKRALANLRAVNKSPDGSYTTDGGKTWFVRYRVPTELLLFIQRWFPEFGKDSKDIDLLVRVWCDLVRVGKDHRPHTKLFVEKEFRRNVEQPRSPDATPDPIGRLYKDLPAPAPGGHD
jgi:hypothetical protein